MNATQKRFRMSHLSFNRITEFTEHEDDAPTWLTSRNTVKGSTMDSRWFWEEHVLTLEVGQHVLTDFNRIERIN